MSSTNKTTYAAVPFLIFGIILITAFFLKYFEPKLPEVLQNWAEHLSIALIVAVVIGLTYEYTSHLFREEILKNLLHESQEQVYQALRAYSVLTPDEVFHLLKEIASQINQTPTLFHPARPESNEYTFTESMAFFDTLVKMRPKEIVKILSTWIEPKSHKNLKYLASDFIGKYQLSEITEELRRQAEPILNLGNLPEDDRGWVLNYIWAYSRCEKPMYKILGDVMRTTSDHEIEKWILFLPLQMPSIELANMINNYLERDAPIADDNLLLVIQAVAALHRAQVVDGVALLKKFPNRFGPHHQEDVERIWRNYALVPEELKGIFLQT
jgi:prepilin signal peptidase PulO-like enzyme (type II secretory pathway)